jgi:hypothetical protein
MKYLNGVLVIPHLDGLRPGTRVIVLCVPGRNGKAGEKDEGKGGRGV